MSASRSSELWVEGLFFDGKRSRSHDARLGWRAEQLWLISDTGERLLSRDGLRLGTQVSGAAGSLYLADGSVFESRDQTALRAVWRAASGRSSGWWLSRLETNLKLIVLGTVLMLGFLVGSFTHGIPWVSRLVAEALPVEVERYLGQQSLDSLDRWLEPSRLSEERQAEVLASFQPYLQQWAEEYPQYSLEVLFRHGDRLGANAMALPAGIIVFTDELVELARDDRELVSILAHEVGHVVHRHSLRGIVQSSLAVWMMVALTGDLSAASDMAASLPAVLASLSYSRGMEREADAFALQFMREQQLDLRHFANIMLRLEGSGSTAEQAGGLTDFLSTHPPTRERLVLFETEAQD